VDVEPSAQLPVDSEVGPAPPVAGAERSGRTGIVVGVGPVGIAGASPAPVDGALPGSCRPTRPESVE
jgi:hypothetical protein